MDVVLDTACLISGLPRIESSKIKLFLFCFGSFFFWVALCSPTPTPTPAPFLLFHNARSNFKRCASRDYQEIIMNNAMELDRCCCARLELGLIYIQELLVYTV